MTTLTNEDKKNEHREAKSLSNSNDSFKIILQALEKQRKALDDQDIVIANQKKEIGDVNQTMKVVVIVLLVMVGTMIFSLQIAIWQKPSDDSKDINIILPDHSRSPYYLR